jgi:hypothetical protein
VVRLDRYLAFVALGNSPDCLVIFAAMGISSYNLLPLYSVHDLIVFFSSVFLFIILLSSFGFCLVLRKGQGARLASFYVISHFQDLW